MLQLAPHDGGPTEVGGLSSSNLPLFDIPSDTNARRPSQKAEEELIKVSMKKVKGVKCFIYTANANLLFKFVHRRCNMSQKYLNIQNNLLTRFS